MTTTYRVMLCCNDEHGHFAGRVCEVQVGDEIRIACTKERGPTMAFLCSDGETPDRVRVGACIFTCSGRNSWVGNVFWESTSMSLDTARLLVRELLGHGWAIEEHAEDGPFADLAATHESRAV